MSVCGTASAWSKIALILIVIGLVLHVAGFATMYWQQIETIQENTVYSVGLWKAYDCSGGHDSPCTDHAIPDSYISGKQWHYDGDFRYVFIFTTNCFICIPFLALVSLTCFRLQGPRN